MRPFSRSRWNLRASSTSRRSPALISFRASGVSNCSFATRSTILPFCSSSSRVAFASGESRSGVEPSRKIDAASAVAATAPPCQRPSRKG